MTKAQEVTAEAGRVFVAIAPHAWGQSEKSPALARRRARANVPTYIKKYTVHVYEIVGEFLGVSDTGSIRYKGECREIVDA